MKLFKNIVIICLLVLSHSALADGVFMVVKGDVKLQSKGKSAVPAKVGMKVAQTDKIIAGKEGRAKVVMVDKNILNISPNTSVLIETYKFNESKNDKNVSLNVIYGKVRATVNQKYDGDKNKFQVKTPSAVAGVRGTDCLTSYNQSTNASRVITFEGNVVVGSGLDSSGAIMNAVSVPAGNFSVAANSAPPTPPAPVPASELQAMNKDSAIDNVERQPASPENKPEKKEGAEKPTDKSGEKRPPVPTGKPNGQPVAGRGPNNVPGPGPAPIPTRFPIPEPPPEPPIPMPIPPDPFPRIYEPPKVSTDLLQQNTNLTVNIRVNQ